MWYDGGMGKEWQRDLLRFLKLAVSLICVSLCMAMEALLFFSLQEVWKQLIAGNLQLGDVAVFALSLVLSHTPFHAGVIWFSRQAQRLWDSSPG